MKGCSKIISKDCIVMYGEGLALELIFGVFFFLIEVYKAFGKWFKPIALNKLT